METSHSIGSKRRAKGGAVRADSCDAGAVPAHQERMHSLIGHQPVRTSYWRHTDSGSRRPVRVRSRPAAGISTIIMSPLLVGPNEGLGEQVDLLAKALHYCGTASETDRLLHRCRKLATLSRGGSLRLPA